MQENKMPFYKFCYICIAEMKMTILQKAVSYH